MFLVLNLNGTKTLMGFTRHHVGFSRPKAKITEFSCSIKVWVLLETKCTVGYKMVAFVILCRRCLSIFLW